MIYECELTEGDLEGSYLNPMGCPLFLSMVRSGVPVFSVGGTEFLTTDRNMHTFTHRLQQLADKLCDKAFSGDRSILVGERFTVEL